MAANLLNIHLDKEPMLRTRPLSSLTHNSVFLLCILGLLLTGCQVPLVVAPTPTPQAVATPADDIEPMAPLPVEQALPPASLAIPELGLESAVMPMSWTIADVNGQRTTKWQVPLDTAGWHVNSTGVGAAGRLLISGHQAQGAALFKPLALGEIAVGQAVDITDEEGLVFVYRVTEVSEPIPLTGATAEDEAAAAAYAEPTTEPLLTLVTGWPEFTTTHRVFAVAELIGVRR